MPPTGGPRRAWFARWGVMACRRDTPHGGAASPAHLRHLTHPTDVARFADAAAAPSGRHGSRLETGPVVRATFVLTPIAPSLPAAFAAMLSMPASAAYGCGARTSRSLRPGFRLTPVASLLSSARRRRCVAC